MQGRNLISLVHKLEEKGMDEDPVVEFRLRKSDAEAVVAELLTSAEAASDPDRADYLTVLAGLIEHQTRPPVEGSEGPGVVLPFARKGEEDLNGDDQR